MRILDAAIKGVAVLAGVKDADGGARFHRCRGHTIDGEVEAGDMSRRGESPVNRLAVAQFVLKANVVGAAGPNCWRVRCNGGR